MHIEDRFTVAAPAALVWAAIRDPVVVAPCVPGCRAVEALSDTLFRAEVAISLGVIKATFHVEVEVLSEMPGLEVRSRTRGEEGGRASMVSADNLLRIEAAGDEVTIVIYQSDVSVTGRLGKFGLGIMRKKAESIGREFADRFQARLLQSAG